MLLSGTQHLRLSRYLGLDGRDQTLALTNSLSIPDLGGVRIVHPPSFLFVPQPFLVTLFHNTPLVISPILTAAYNLLFVFPVILGHRSKSPPWPVKPCVGWPRGSSRAFLTCVTSF